MKAVLNRQHRVKSSRTPVSFRADLWLLVMITLVGATLRLLWLDRIPTGWHHDEALMGVMAAQVYYDIHRPIFFAGYLGQEPLYLYLVSGMMWLLGGDTGILPVRLTSAFAGLATIPLTYLLGREMYSRRVGLIAAALMSFSFWQVMSGRNGYRSITLPLVAALAMYLYWKARRSHSKARRSHSMGAYILAGTAVGGSWYTYLAGRAFPLVFGLYGMGSLLASRLQNRRKAMAWAILGLATAIAVVPLLYFWATNPGTFGARMGQIFFWGAEPGKGSPWAVLWGNTTKLIGIFTVYGEPLWRYNISSRPIFVWALAPAFWLGTAIVTWRALRRDPASLMVVAWLVAMSLPCILSEEVGAYTLRAMGMVPAVYLLPALGLTMVWEWLEGQAHRARLPGMARAGAVLVVVILLLDAKLTYHHYFNIWAPSFGAEFEDGTDMVAASRYLQREARPDQEEVVMGSEFLGHPVVAQLAPRVYDQLRWVDGNKAVVFHPNASHPTLYVFPFTTSPNSGPWNLDYLLPPETEVGSEYFQQGITPEEPPPALYRAYRVTPEQAQAQVQALASQPGTTALEAEIGGVATALSARLPQRVVQGETLPASALWRLLGSPGDQDYVFFAHLLDHQHRMWAQYNENGYAVSQWRPGEVLATRLDMAVPKDAPPGRYRLEIGIFDRRAGTRLPLSGEKQRGSLILAGWVKVAAAEPQPLPALANPISAQLGDSIALAGFEAAKQDQVGNMLEVKLGFRAIQTPPEDYTVFVQLLSPAGQLVAQSDAMPQGGQQPTGSWDPGEEILDTHILKLPSGLPPGQYRLIAGMYLASTGERLPVAGSDDGSVNLITIDLP